MNPKNRMDDVIFISIPASQPQDIGGFELDPSILLPVDRGSMVQDWNPEQLSWEMILSGMLKVLAFMPNHEDADYFRRFVLASRPAILEELTEAGIIKARNRDFELAEEIFLAVLGISPGNCRFLLNLALLYEDMARSHANLDHEEEKEECEEKAATWYKRALSLDEVVPEAYLYAGHFYLRNHELGQAKNQFEAFLIVAPEDEQAEPVRKLLAGMNKQETDDTRFKEAYDFIRLGKHETGIEKIRLFLADNPEIWNGWFMLGWGLRKEKHYKEALAAFDKAEKFGGGNPDTLNEAAICAMELGDFPLARKKLQQALQQEPENMKIISNLGILAMKDNRIDEARSLFLTVLEFVPDDPIAKKFLEHLA